MSAPPQVLVTRPREDAQRWARQLHDHGLAAEVLPLIDIAPLLDAGQRAALWPGLSGYAALMFVSGNAVTHLLGEPAPAWPPGVRALAPGPGTASALRERGVPADLIDSPPAQAAQFDSQALWQVIGHQPWQGRRVLIVRGQGDDAGPSVGRDWLAEQFRRAGAQVEILPVYRRAAPAFSPAQRQRMAQAQADGSIWLFSSSEAIAHLPADLRWHAARALATHERIAQAAQRAGFGQVLQCRPTLADVVASIKSLAT